MTFTLLANAIAADAGLIPGFTPLGPLFGLPLSVLAAFLERPFYTRGGVTQSTIWFSLQANLISLLVGYVFVLLFVPLAMSGSAIAALLCPVAAVAVSIFTEREYLRHAAGWTALELVWVVLGNVFSAAVCIGLVVAANLIRESYAYDVVKYANEYAFLVLPLNIALAVGSITLFIAAFCLPRGPVADAPLPQDG